MYTGSFQLCLDTRTHTLHSASHTHSSLQVENHELRSSLHIILMSYSIAYIIYYSVLKIQCIMYMYKESKIDVQEYYIRRLQLYNYSTVALMLIPVSHSSPLHPALHAHSPGGMQSPFTHSAEHWNVNVPSVGVIMSTKSSAVVVDVCMYKYALR